MVPEGPLADMKTGVFSGKQGRSTTQIARPSARGSRVCALGSKSVSRIRVQVA